MELQLVVLDREERIGAPLQLVRVTAARLRAAAPLIGEQDLLAVVAERGRVPERHVRIGRRVEPDRMRGIADVEEQTEARAGAACQADLGIDSDVVALIGSARRSRVAAARSARCPGRPSGLRARRPSRCCAGRPSRCCTGRPSRCRTGRGGARRSGFRTRLRVERIAVRIARRHGQSVEDARGADDCRLRRGGERHLDHFEPEARRVRIVDPAVRTPRQLVGGAHSRGP